jgi:cobaltochelatase CobT
VTVEVLGFTTATWKGGRSRARWLREGRPYRPGRLCDLLHIVYRSPDDPRASSGGWTFKPMLRPDLLKENVDGEAVTWAASRLLARERPRKLLLAISDGAPVDDSTLMANGPSILDDHLRSVLAEIDRAGRIRTAAVGIGFDVSRYYAVSATVTTPDDLGGAAIVLLERTLLGTVDKSDPATRVDK